MTHQAQDISESISLLQYNTLEYPRMIEKEPGQMNDNGQPCQCPYWHVQFMLTVPIPPPFYLL